MFKFFKGNSLIWKFNPYFKGKRHNRMRMQKKRERKHMTTSVNRERGGTDPFKILEELSETITVLTWSAMNLDISLILHIKKV